MDAKIPEESAVQYAISFQENRMDMNMLMDLDKEYLRDLKITALGDIISILKQAKIQHDRLLSARVLNPDSGNNSPSSNIERSQPRLTEKITQEPKPFSNGPKSRPVSMSVKEDDTGQNIHKRLGPLVSKVKEEASSSVFSRLGDQEELNRFLDVGHKKATKSAGLEESKSSSSTSRSSPPTPKTGSIFGRLGPETKEITPQELEVSSSSDSHAHGILKTRQIGVGKTKTLSPLGPSTKKLSIAKRLGNQTNIISLKKPLKETSGKRVSFGENEVRNMITGEVSTDQRPKSPANIQDLRSKLDPKVTIGGNQLKVRPISSPKNLMIKTRPTPITAPASTTSIAASSARIKPPLETSTRIKPPLETSTRIKPPPETSTRIKPPLETSKFKAKARIGLAKPTEATRVSINGGGIKARIGEINATSAVGGSRTVIGGARSSSPIKRGHVTPPGASGSPARANVHLNPKMIKLHTVTPQTASTSSAGILAASKAKTSVKNRIGEKDLQVKLSGEKLKRTVARTESPPAKAAVKRTIGRDEIAQDDVEREEAGIKPKKKRLVMIKTKADGTKTRQVISEDDPILQKVTVTKLRKSASASSMVSSSKKSFEDIEDESLPTKRRPLSPSSKRRALSPPMKRRPLSPSRSRSPSPPRSRRPVSPSRSRSPSPIRNRRTASPTRSRRPVSPSIRLPQLRNLESDEDVEPVKDDFTVRIRATTSSSHRTLAGKAMELAVRDENRAFQGRGTGDGTFLTLASRAKAASLSREEEERMEEKRSRRMSMDKDVRIEEGRSRRMSMEDEGRSRRMSMEKEERSRRMSMEEDARMERLSIEEERMRKISMEEERIKKKLAENNERSRRMAEEEERERRMALEDNERYEMEEAGRGRVFGRLGGKQRY